MKQGQPVELSGTYAPAMFGAIINEPNQISSVIKSSVEPRISTTVTGLTQRYQSIVN